MELSAIVPLPVTIAGNTAAAFGPLADAAPVARVVSSLVGVAKVCEPQRIVVVAAGPVVNEAAETLSDQGSGDVSVTVTAAGGSGTRADCVAAGLKYLLSQDFSTHYVLIHEFRWPLTSAALTERVTGQLRTGAQVVMPMLPLTDSVIAVDERRSVTGTVDRSQLRSVQYPRGFTVDRLAQLLSQNTSDEFDEFDQALRIGVPITVVDGDPRAFAVDLPADRALAEAIIAIRSAE